MSEHVQDMVGHRFGSGLVLFNPPVNRSHQHPHQQMSQQHRQKKQIAWENGPEWWPSSRPLCLSKGQWLAIELDLERERDRLAQRLGGMAGPFGMFHEQADLFRRS